MGNDTVKKLLAPLPSRDTQKYGRDDYWSILRENLLNPKEAFRRIGAKFLYERSPLAADIINEPGGWKALHRIYQNEPETWIDRKLLGLRACEGTRERKDEYQKMLEDSVYELCREGCREINMLELGSGSGVVPMDVLCKLKNNGARVNLVLVDRNKRALEFSEGIAQQYGISEHVRFKRYNVKKVFEKEQAKYHIVGTHGLLDYFNDGEAVEFFRGLSKVLVPGGRLIASNMTTHEDWLARRMMEFFGGWKLIYRTPEEFRVLLEKSNGFEDIQAALLEMGFHVMVTGRKKGLRDWRGFVNEWLRLPIKSQT